MNVLCFLNFGNGRLAARGFLLPKENSLRKSTEFFVSFAATLRSLRLKGFNLNEDMKKLVVLTGAGMSSESGIKTFRDSGGLWEEYDVTEVATPMAWMKNRDLVLRFYNERRRQLAASKPNEGHFGLAELEKNFDVQIITQNIDDLHERAGSTKILHLHGELTKARSTVDQALIYDIGYKDINTGEYCEKGSQLRPHIVWFGEAVPMMDEAVTSDIECGYIRSGGILFKCLSGCRVNRLCSGKGISLAYRS